MKVILLSDVKKLGKKGDVVEVSDGYAKNFLMKQKLAVQVTKKSMEILDEQHLQQDLHYHLQFHLLNLEFLSFRQK